MNQKKNHLGSELLLLLTAFIWGTAFVAQRSGMDYLGPLTFNAIRTLLGGIALLPVIYFFGKAKKRTNEEETALLPSSKKTLALGGIACGIILFIAMYFQQAGIVYTTAGKAGFITTLYIVLVPLFGIFLGKKVRPIIWLCVGLAVIGLYLLSIKSGFSIGKGDLLIFICSFFYAGHILIIDHFSPKVDGIKMSCIQFFIVALLSFAFAIPTETITWKAILDCWFPILYSGVLNCGVAFTLQIVGQKKVEPSIASLLLSLESVFAVISGVIILGESITIKESFGCVIMFIAIILAQLPSKNKDGVI
ncbi:MAG: DMT family transporter [Anaerovoracaceae bacterium]